ncbi:zinc finger protein [Macleaya cordata]|uniref:Zinc finger protein n=1 Tax=Macleaya cordata TaxID=56857 RepID=A0A200QB53_MACCD|nr:zinc finger protein [Macleaya cordata]
MSHDELEKLPCFEFKALEKGTSPVDCAVCLENFKMGEKCRLLPICKHSFHAQCVDSWLLKTPICPICRTSAGSQRKAMVSGHDESSRSREVRLELRENQSVEVGTQVNSNSTPIPSSSPSEHVV